KGMTAAAIKMLVGEQYTSSIEFGEFDKNVHASSGLIGKKLNIIEETETGYINKKNFKKYTGGSQIMGNPKHRSIISFESQAQMLVTLNEIPNFNEISDAIDRRVCIFHFNQFNPNKRNDRFLEEVLRPQAAAAIKHALTY